MPIEKQYRIVVVVAGLRFCSKYGTARGARLRKGLRDAEKGNYGKMILGFWRV